MQERAFDLIIIGAGAAGLMCAGTAAERGQRVLLLDHADRVGKKILISGGGRCNFTNRFATAANYISQNPHFCKSALARFSAHDFIQWVEHTGIPYHERKHGQLFCDRSARDILDMLLAPCQQHDVTIAPQNQITAINKDEQFHVMTTAGEYTAKHLVIATGGASIPKMGATSFGLKIAEQFGLAIVPPRPGLVPFTFTGHEKENLRALAGISLEVEVHCNNHIFREAMLFTHRGLSGPAMLQISSYWQPGDSLTINLLPAINIADLIDEKRHTQLQLATLLGEHLPRRLLHLRLPLSLREQPLAQLNKQQIHETIQRLQVWNLKPNGSEGYRTAEVTVGGVSTAELSSKSMESKRISNLYFIGEVVDVTGQLGGFNFQWAWSSGYAAAVAISE